MLITLLCLEHSLRFLCLQSQVEQPLPQRYRTDFAVSPSRYPNLFHLPISFSFKWRLHQFGVTKEKHLGPLDLLDFSDATANKWSVSGSIRLWLTYPSLSAKEVEHPKNKGWKWEYGTALSTLSALCGVEALFLDGSVWQYFELQIIRPHVINPLRRLRPLDSYLLILTGHALFAAPKESPPCLFLPGYGSETHKIVKLFKYQLPSYLQRGYLHSLQYSLSLHCVKVCP